MRNNFRAYYQLPNERKRDREREREIENEWETERERERNRKRGREIEMRVVDNWKICVKVNILINRSKEKYLPLFHLN